MSDIPESNAAPGAWTPGAADADLSGRASPIEGDDNVALVGISAKFPTSAVEFLRAFAPRGPWCLSAIEPDTRVIETHTFGPDTAEACEAWIARWNGVRNVYFTVNPVMRAMNKKPERTDIAALAWLHVDIDPRTGEDLESERVRALGLLTEKLPKGVPAPNVVVDSGGGYQGFWKLRTPVEIGCELAKAEDAKRWNQKLEHLFRADSCHNIDRLMRLPFTWNLPDAKKLKKGRTKTMATPLRCDVSFGYSLEDLPAPVPVQPSLSEPEAKAKSGRKAKAAAVAPRSLGSVDELDQWGVPDRLKIIAVQGRHPDEPKKGNGPGGADDNSRSVWVHDFCCGLVRCEVPDEIILGILLDPQFGISESVLEKGSNAKKYAARQLERAKEKADAPELAELNDRYTLIADFGGKPRVVYEVWDPIMQRHYLGVQSVADFCVRYENRSIVVGTDAKGNPLYKPLGKWWREHPKRNQRERVVFAPGRDIPDAYNLWSGFVCEAKAGDCKPFLSHLRDNVCAGNADHYDWLIGWMANAVQHPDRPAWSAVVLKGKRGVGKSFAAEQFGLMFGRHFLAVNSIRLVTGNFNAHLQDVVVLFADEAVNSGDDTGRGVLNSLITQDFIAIERKGIDVQNAPNFLHIIIASNDEHIIPAGADERRYFVLEVGEGRAKDIPYFRALAECMDSGGREALLHYLLNHDLSGWEPRRVPDTDALRQQKEQSMPEVDKFILGILEAGEVGAHRPPHAGFPPGAFVSHTERSGGLIDIMRERVPGLRQWSDHSLGRALGKWGAERRKSGARYWVLPSPPELRARWEAKYGARPWPDAESFWEDDRHLSTRQRTGDREPPPEGTGGEPGDKIPF